MSNLKIVAGTAALRHYQYQTPQALFDRGRGGLTKIANISKLRSGVGGSAEAGREKADVDVGESVAGGIRNDRQEISPSVRRDQDILVGLVG